MTPARMPLFAAALALAATLAAPAPAQELAFDPGRITACLDGATTRAAREACIGIAAESCMAETPGGSSTVGMGACLQRELAWWDARLNANYRRAMAEARDFDAGMTDAERGGARPVARALRAMQRAWIPFRDATCAYERSFWTTGTGAGPAELSCLLRMTARQALYLEPDPLE